MPIPFFILAPVAVHAVALAIALRHHAHPHHDGAKVPRSLRRLGAPGC